MPEIQDILDQYPTSYDAGEMIRTEDIQRAMIEYAKLKCKEQRAICQLHAKFGEQNLLTVPEPFFEDVADLGGT